MACETSDSNTVLRKTLFVTSLKTLTSPALGTHDLIPLKSLIVAMAAHSDL